MQLPRTSRWLPRCRSLKFGVPSSWKAVFILMILSDVLQDTAQEPAPVRTATGTLWNRNFLQPKLSQLTDLLPIRPALPNADSHGKVCSCGSGIIRSGRRLCGQVFAGGAKVHHDHAHQQAKTGHIRQRASSHAAHRRHGQARYGSSVSGKLCPVGCTDG